MLSRRIRSALFIDFENISSYCPADKIDAWVGWLEEGEFDENGRRRRLVQKRIYLNASHGKYHAPFNDKRFEIVIRVVGEVHVRRHRAPLQACNERY